MLSGTLSHGHRDEQRKASSPSKHVVYQESPKIKVVIREQCIKDKPPSPDRKEERVSLCVGGGDIVTELNRFHPSISMSSAKANCHCLKEADAIHLQLVWTSWDGAEWALLSDHSESGKI